ncbi:tetratricopeptide repeat protein [Desulfofundulus thermobenzoicus]|uniref:Tetratricopeptide repeat protein n=2 Tax=Desulfofundulus thermobenzoicus TaxID=29376 RepID=A0A6N7IP16_9FIRM|nr:tetratricopeptide repeat protein [Desulfofundulus thermobenzoicus]
MLAKEDFCGGDGSMNRVLVVVLVAVGLLLNGCAQFPTPGELIKPPVVKMEAASAEAAYSPAELKQIVMPFLPPGATLLADQQTDDKTSGGKSRETIRVADLNGDGVTEIIAGYRISQGSVGVMVLQQREKWEKVWQEEGKGYNLERLQLADITGDGRDELLIGWTIGASAGDGLDIMSWQGDGLKRIATSGYHRLEVEDLAGEFGQDGKQELAVWVRDTGDAFWVNVLRWDGQKLAEAEDTYSAYFPRVVEYYRQRIKEGGPLSPRFYWYYLADALVKVKDYQGALEAVEKGAALDNNGSPPDAHFLPVRGRALLGLQRYQEALTVYQSLVGEITGVKLLQPDRFSSRGEVTRDTFPARLPNPVMRMLGEAYWGIGEAYLGLGQREEAVASLQKAVDLVPDWDKPRNALDRLTLPTIPWWNWCTI